MWTNLMFEKKEDIKKKFSWYEKTKDQTSLEDFEKEEANK